MRAHERFLKYVTIPTTSNEDNSNCPSTKGQWDFAKMISEEMKSLNIQDVRVDDNCYVYGRIPAKGEKGATMPKIGLVAHMDTAPASPGEPIKPRIEEKYTGGVIKLENGLEIDPKMFEFLNGLKGQDIIVTDGNTLLGADDKAGVSEIMTLCEKLNDANAPDHAEVLIAFTPDEEIGRGADLFDVKNFGADFAYTVDGGELGELEYENFNAAQAEIIINGVNIHPGSAKGKMKNAARIAAEFDQLLPEFDRPENTENYEGFFHLCGIEANEEKARCIYIIRDHSSELFAKKKEQIKDVVYFLNRKYGEGTVILNTKDSYYNMREKVLPHPEIIERAKKAFETAGVKPISKPIRGGTDGSRLSYMGLVCPNLSTGGHNFHGRLECISVQSMDKMTEVLLNIVSL